MAKNKPYKTPRNSPKCLKYWDKTYKGKEYNFDWQIMRALVQSKIPEIQAELELSLKECREVAWNAYCAAIEGDEDSPYWQDYQEFSSFVY